MIFSRNYLHINSQKKELPEQGLELFNLAANDGDIHQFPGNCISLHWHSEIEIFILLQGYVEVRIGEKSFHLVSGEGCFINTGVLHSFYTSDTSPCHYRSFVFDSSIVSGMPGSVFDVKYVRPLLNKGASFMKLGNTPENAIYFEQFDIAFAACQKEFDGYEFTVREALAQIVFFLSKHCTSDSPSFMSIQEKRLRQMLEWIDENINKNIFLKDLSQAANICPRECQRIFHKYLHCSPMDYIRRQRILISTQILSDTDDPITDIALKCGFSSPSYFSNQFKYVTGKTPTEYRILFYNKH